MANYRNEFIKAHPGKRRLGKKGYWYRCSNCGKWCGRPGSDNVRIPNNMKMEVDHIVPWSKGGSDSVYNLQPMCKPCNRNKSDDMTGKDAFKATINHIAHPVDSLLGTTVRGAARQNKILKKTGIVKRK